MNQKAAVSFTVSIFIALSILSAGPSIAQDTPEAEVQTPPPADIPPPGPPRPVRWFPIANEPEAVLNLKTVVMPLQYLDFNTLENYARSVEVGTYPDSSGENVILSGPEKAIAKVQEFINLFSAPPKPKKNVLLTFYLVTAGKESPEPGLELDPQARDGIRNLLNTALGISQFFVWDTLFLRARDNDTAELSGFLPPVGEMAENAPGPASFQMRIGNVKSTLMGEEPSRIALDSLMLGIELEVSRNAGPGNQPRPVSRQNIGFESNLNIREGQMEIVGKTSISSKGDSIVVIVSAQVLKD